MPPYVFNYEHYARDGNQRVPFDVKVTYAYFPGIDSQISANEIRLSVEVDMEPFNQFPRLTIIQDKIVNSIRRGALRRVVERIENEGYEVVGIEF